MDINLNKDEGVNSTKSKQEGYTDDDEDQGTLSKRMEEVQGYWSEQYTNMHCDQRFASGDQWTKEAKAHRKGKPTLTLNFTKAYIDRIVNPIRKHPFGIRVKHENSQINELYQGLIRDIEYRSTAAEAYEEGLRNAVTSGIGYIIIDTDYEDNTSLNQTINIVSVPEATNVWVDPYIKKIDGSDMMYAFHVTYIDKSIAEKQYDLENDREHLTNYSEMYRYWTVPENSIPEMIYYNLRTEKRTRYWMEDGSFVDSEEELTGIIAGEREIDYKYVEVCKYIGGKKVSQTRLDIEYIPVVPVYGDRVYKEGWKGFAGIVHSVFHSQSMVNYYASSEAQLIQSAPVSPWIIAEGQIEGYEEIWATANTGMHDHLPYKPDTLGGQQVAPPTRASNAADVSHLTGPRMGAVEDMQRETGIYASQLGKEDVAGQSGRALLLKQSTADVTTYHYIDNLMKSITQCGKITIQLINSLYDTTRKLNVRAEDGSVVPIQGNIQEMGIKPYEFDTEVEAGPMLQNEKEMTNATLLELAAIMPEKFSMVADVFVENMQSAGSDEVVRRLKAMLPPELLPKDESNPQMDPQAMQALQAAEQTIAQSKQMMDEYAAIIQNLQTQIIDNESDRKAKIEVEQIKSQTDLAIAEMSNATKIQIEAMKGNSSAQSDNKKIMADRQKQINANISKMMADTDTAIQEVVTMSEPMDQVAKVGGPIGPAEDAVDAIEFGEEVVESIDDLIQ